ncbi:type IV secretory system conjugative DNA transfer family protein [Agrobacterium tumefaciens]|uniref:type IV secretory system conjugative DNA transfer family protein n=1 Tax=Agrobacterium tumefaciens TaxID=358 RepID=UPI0015718EEC|nr:type IV secretory system conjugative DNA transfer family protein [Agrobacterium tumefaciens]NTB05906.1 type IV secretory system conjugative DNA transfer family protein [Agrobacterium tumefaciens]
MRTGQRNQSVHFSGKILVVFFLCVALSSWIATQYFARAVAYHNELGEPAWLIGSNLRIYHPFSWIGWALEWIGSTGLLEQYVTNMLLIFCGGLAVSLLLGFYLYYRRSLKTETPTNLHGSARWATVTDLEKMRLVSFERATGPFYNRKVEKWQATGPYVGAFDVYGKRQVLRYSDPAHIMCYAPSRSGKGIGPVLCTLLSYPYSVYVNDIKGENHALSSGFRHSAGTLVMRFDPTTVDDKSIDGTSRYNDAVCWNALAEIRIFTLYDVKDAQNLSAQIADPKGEGMDDHWVSTSYELLTGVTLHVAYAEHDKTLTGVATYLADPSFTDPEQMFLRMLEAEHDPSLSMGWVDSLGKPTKTHPTVALAARAMLNKEEKERNSVLSTAKTKLSLYTEPIVARNTARSDFCVDDLMNHTKPVSFYQVVPPADKERLRPLIRLFISFALTRFASDMEFEDGRSVKNYHHRLLMLLDELASLKKLEPLTDTLGYLAGYGVTVFMFVQDRLQIKEIYGDKETLTAGCQIQIAFAPNTAEGAEDIAKKTGTTTETRQNVSYSGTRMGAMLGQMSISEELHERYLMTDDEVSRMDRDRMIVFNTGHPPIFGHKLKYYEMPVFQQRAEVPSPSKVTMTYLGPDKKLVSKWFMVSCQRQSGSKEFALTINVYSDFPETTLILKQENLATEEVMEFEYQLCELNGASVKRALDVDDLQFIAKPVGDVSAFDPTEAFEMHFVTRNIADFKFPTQIGFYRDMSIYERKARRAVRSYFHKLEKDEGRPTEPMIERVKADQRYAGQVFLVTDHYVAIHRLSNREHVSLHRISKLDKAAPGVGASVTIRYTGKKGTVVHA